MGKINIGVIGRNRSGLIETLTDALLRTAHSQGSIFEIRRFNPSEHSELFKAWLPPTQDRVNVQLRQGSSSVGGKKQCRPKLR